MRRQAVGLVVVVLIAAAVFLLKRGFPGAYPCDGDFQIPHGDFRNGPIVVKLTGAVAQNGVYFLPEKETLAGFLQIAGIQRPTIPDTVLFEGTLQTGQTISVHAGDRIVIGEMKAAERLALNMPIDLNRATLEELTMVSGIGERTAEKILSFRNGEGRFRTVEDLQKISGIKEKKLSRLRQYFFVKAPSGKPDQTP